MDPRTAEVPSEKKLDGLGENDEPLCPAMGLDIIAEEVTDRLTPVPPVERKGEEEEEEEDEGGGAKVTFVPPSVIRRLPCALSLSRVKIGTCTLHSLTGVRKIATSLKRATC